jgi:polyphosphate kinase
VAKVNSLIDPDIIYKLYEASEAGVKIELIVRGINGLRGAVEGLSDNIRVRSIVGRYLEHDRIYKFHAGGKNLIFIGSADLMPRNLVRRVEIIFPITDPGIKKRLEETLNMMLRDNVKSRMQMPDGSYEYIKNQSPEFCSQEMIYKNLARSLKESYTSQDAIFIPIKGENNK